MATKRNTEWLYMDTLRPPVYVCLQRRRFEDGSYPRFKLDGRVDKDEWSHVPWSDPFLDIEGSERKPREYPLTRIKMMYDDDHLYIGAELLERKIWGTIRTKNATLYHENDFEVFLNPDGSRHNYYELELNCLNTIWELVLNKPYKDGHSIQNPYNLESTRTAVYVDGVTNSPLTECHKWCVEIAIELDELAQFDSLRDRAAEPGDVWRVNFSRVQYHLRTVVDDETKQLTYEKLPDTREDNIVWAPTGVVDIHRPEKWGFVLFSSADDEHDGILELNDVMESFLCEQIAMERVLDTIYYDQRTFCESNSYFAESLEQLYGSMEAFPCLELVNEFELEMPQIQRRQKKVEESLSPRGGGGGRDGGGGGRVEPSRRRSYAPKLDPDDEEDEEGEEEGTTSKRTQVKMPVKMPCLEYTVTITSATQEWNMDQDARLWMTV